VPEFPAVQRRRELHTRHRAIVGATALLLACALGAGFADAAGNRATPLKPKRGAEFTEGKPTVVVGLRWKLPTNEIAGHIEISRKPKTNPNGSFKQVTRSEGLQDRQKDIRIGIAKANRYYWHVSSGKPGRKEVWGPTSTFVVLNTMSRDEALKFTKRMIADRITKHYALKRIGCHPKSKFASRCEWSLQSAGYTFSARGTTFLKRKLPDNLRFYHYDFHVDFTNDACVADHHGKTKKCGDTVHWRA
jgi:hypothetical protein